MTVFMQKAPHFMGEVYYYHFYQDDSGKEYCFHLKDSYYHAVTILNEKEGKCYYISQGWLAEKVNNGYHLENFFWLEKILQMFQCMVLHSCHIQKDGEAILFTAPSGTGKSTQGDLWVQYNDAEVINGDRTAIRKVNGQWMAYGLPFCGTSGIHKNHQEPIRGITVIRQYPENRAMVLRGRDAFSAIYSELLCYPLLGICLFEYGRHGGIRKFLSVMCTVGMLVIMMIPLRHYAAFLLTEDISGYTQLMDEVKDYREKYTDNEIFMVDMPSFFYLYADITPRYRYFADQTDYEGVVDGIREDLNDYVQESCKATILIVKSRGMAYESIGNYEMAGMYYHNRELMSVYEYME